MRRIARSSGATPSPKAASTGMTRRASVWACWTAIASAWAREVVLGRDRVAGRLPGGVGHEHALVPARARGEHVRGRGLAHLEQRLGGEDVEPQDHGHRDEQHGRGCDQAARVAAGEVDRRLGCPGEHRTVRDEG